MFYICTTSANLKIQLKPSMSEIRNYLVANPIERPSTPKTGFRVGRLPPKLKVQNLSPNEDSWLFHHMVFSPSPFNSQAGYLSSKIIPSRKEASLENWFFLAFGGRGCLQEGAHNKKSREGERENNTRANVWASFGPVSRVVAWLQAYDSRFLSTTILTLS